MKKNIWNILVDALNWVVLMALISTGLILKFILPHGSGSMDAVGRGRGWSEKTVDVLCGLTRHEWGQIHLYVALAFLALIVAHVALHWNWVKAVTFGVPKRPRPLLQKIITVGIVILAILALAFPWLGKKESYTRREVQA